MVRNAVFPALQMLQQKQSEDPDGPLSNLDLNLSKDEQRLLRIAALLHDIGKSTATKPHPKTGKIGAFGHETPKFYKPAMEKLSPFWKNIRDKVPQQDLEDFEFLMQNHMKLGDEGIEKKALRKEMLDDEGKYKNERKYKVLLAIWMADRMGRGKPEGQEQWGPEERKAHAQGNVEQGQGRIDSMYAAAELAKKQRAAAAAKAEKQAQLQAMSPEEFIQQKQGMLKPDALKHAVANKYSPEIAARLLGEGFRAFMESLEPSAAVDVGLSTMVPDKKELQAVYKLKTALQNSGLGSPEDIEVRIVGGAVRDFMMHKFHGDPNKQYKPKDIDLTTNLSEEEILRSLRQPEVKQLGVKVKEKESVDTFGVVFANVDGYDFEIAPYRKDVGGGGRRPDEVERGTIQDDAMRRDLTMNNLYYDLDDEKIFDYNEDGQGIKDIKSMTARFVGDPADRMREDFLRIPRMVRFFSRFNPGDIMSHLDEKTLAAVKQYSDLPGITPERIMQEFMSGIKSAKNTASFLKNYAQLGLLDTAFKGHANKSGLDRLGNEKDPRVIFSELLRDMEPQQAEQLLKQLKYDSNLSSEVNLLMQARTSGSEKGSEIWQAAQKKLLQGKKHKHPMSHPDEEKRGKPMTQAEIDRINRKKRVGAAKSLQAAQGLADPEQQAALDSLQRWGGSTATSQDAIKKGHTGRDIGNYLDSQRKADWDAFVKRRQQGHEPS
jgi:tRNA nucleotidyltransferase/poly(A) polymerase